MNDINDEYGSLKTVDAALIEACGYILKSMENLIKYDCFRPNLGESGIEEDTFIPAIYEKYKDSDGEFHAKVFREVAACFEASLKRHIDYYKDDKQLLDALYDCGGDYENDNPDKIVYASPAIARLNQWTDT